MKILAIYKCVNKITGEVVYVGQSIDQIGRLNSHHRKLLKGRHPNKELQAEFSKYGSAAFVWSRLEFCRDADALCDSERFWKGMLTPTCNKIEPPKAIRRAHARFDPFLQEMRRQLRRKRRSTH